MHVEIHAALKAHPKFRRFCRILDIPSAHGLGLLTSFWLWAMDYALNGDLSKFDALDLAEAADWSGDADKLVSALLGCGVAGGSGFLVRSESGKLLIHDWHKYGGKLLVTRFTDNFRKKHKGAMPTAEQIAAAGLFPLEMLTNNRVSAVPMDSVGIQQNPLDSNVEKSRVEKSRVEQQPPRTHTREGEAADAVVVSTDSGECSEGLEALGAFSDFDAPLPRPAYVAPPEPSTRPPAQSDPYLPDSCAPLDGVTQRPTGGFSYDWARIEAALLKRRQLGDKARATDARYISTRLDEWSKDPARAALVERLAEEIAQRSMEEPARYVRAVIDAWNQNPPPERGKPGQNWSGASSSSSSEGSMGYHLPYPVDQERVNAQAEEVERERREREERIRQQLLAEGKDPDQVVRGSVSQLYGPRRKRGSGGLHRMFESTQEASA